MEFNRNHYFMAGLVIIGLGIQLRLVDSYVLNEQATKIVAKIAKPNSPAAANTMPFLVSAPAVQPRHVMRPPKWIGWALLSVGGVLILHSLAMQKPGGG